MSEGSGIRHGDRAPPARDASSATAPPAAAPPLCSLGSIQPSLLLPPSSLPLPLLLSGSPPSSRQRRPW
jgi:hypothetical protein